MAVAQLVEPLIVIQVVAGSSPVGRPILKPFSLISYGAFPFSESVTKISGNLKVTLKNGWQSKCRVSQCISFDTNLPVKLSVLVTRISVAKRYHVHS